MSSSEEEDNHYMNTTNDSAESAADYVDEETIRIIVSTDNHLGFAENDNVRGNDSFAALEEVLYIAKQKNADMVLLAGDLFHHNKPSRRTLIRTMDIFRRYCLGQDPIQIQICSDQSKNFRRGIVNYEDENYSVGLPIFSIHGNHDDPTREGGTELFAALDLLDTANLVNYVGRQEQVDKVEVSPILIKKANTHLALYGLGSMRDERLNRMWRQNKVTFLKPAEDKQWFNLFALHQNREKGRGAKNCVHESLIPDWMDLVVWGHEHECNIEPQESLVGTFRIIQPGSSVATSLVEGEAERKQIGVLDIRNQAFRLKTIPLTNVRTFVIGEVSLSQQRRLDPEDPKVESKMTQFLEDKVRMLVHDAQEKRQDLEEAAKKEGNEVALAESNPLQYSLEKPDEVLVRVKVEHSKFSTLNNQRFGAKFMECGVANPTDILLFHRKKSPSAASSSHDAKLKKAEPVAPGDIGEMNIEDLIVGELQTSDKNLELFPEKGMTSALESYVQKQQAQALHEAVNQYVDKQQNRLINAGEEGEEEGNDESMRDDDGQGGDDDDDHENKNEVSVVGERKRGRLTSSSKVATTKRKGRATPNFRDEDESDQENEAPAPSRKGRKAVASKAKKSRSSYEDDSDEDDSPPPRSTSKASSRESSRRRSVATYEESGDDDDEIEVVPVKQPARKHETPVASAKREYKSRRSTASTPGSSSQMTQSRLSFPTKKKPAKRSRYQDDSDFEQDQGGSRSYDLDEDWGTAKTSTHD